MRSDNSPSIQLSPDRQDPSPVRPAAVSCFAFLVSLFGVLPAAFGGVAEECPNVLDEDVVQQLILRSATSARPGSSPSFTLGTFQCCVFLVPVQDACVVYEIDPPEAATLELLDDPGEFDPSGFLHLSEALESGDVITLRAIVEEGRAVLETQVHIYTPDSNPLVGYWRESGSIACPSFVRGDQNQDGTTELADAISLFNVLFLGADEPSCLEASDVNADNSIDLSDGIALLSHLFLGGPAPRAPFPECGTANLVHGCENSANCGAPPGDEFQLIQEMVFEADGTFRVTWLPFEAYVDYWGTYTFDLESGAIDFQVSGGNYVPEEFGRVGETNFSTDADSLTIEGWHLGTSNFDRPPRNVCGHRFDAY